MTTSTDSSEISSAASERLICIRTFILSFAGIANRGRQIPSPKLLACGRSTSTPDVASTSIRTGIKETLEYLAFLRINEDYVFGRDTTGEADIFGNGWNGLLVVQDLDRETLSADAQEDEPITILQAGELSEELPGILKNVLNR